jgi:hypothetical protein
VSETEMVMLVSREAGEASIAIMALISSAIVVGTSASSETFIIELIDLLALVNVTRLEVKVIYHLDNKGGGYWMHILLCLNL